MDNDRPSLDLKHFEDICPDKNGESNLNCSSMIWIEIFQVPVIAVFTKYDQFKRNIKIKLMHEHCDPDTEFNTELESAFNQNYLGRLSGPPPFVCLESKDFLINSYPL
jgi:hypothetical protein